MNASRPSMKFEFEVYEAVRAPSERRHLIVVRWQKCRWTCTAPTYDEAAEKADSLVRLLVEQREGKLASARIAAASRDARAALRREPE